MTEEQLQKAHALWCEANKNRDLAAACKAWAEENIIDGYYNIPIDSKYADSIKFIYTSEMCIKIPARVINTIIKCMQQQAEKLQKEFDNIHISFDQ